MGTEPWIGYAPWYIAQQEGYFTKYGLKVNIVNFEEEPIATPPRRRQDRCVNIDTGGPSSSPTRGSRVP